MQANFTVKIEQVAGTDEDAFKAVAKEAQAILKKGGPIQVVADMLRSGLMTVTIEPEKQEKPKEKEEAKVK